MSTDTPRERRKKKAQQAMENRSKAVVESVGKSSPANSFVPAHDGDDVPPMPTAQTDIPKLAEIKGQAIVQNQAGLAMPKSPTLSDMLAEQRKTAIKEKTDAVNMQKYHALTDALGALGKMGGAAIGGAIGGNVMDSAPVVGEYQPSRGYVTAFEKARQANARINELDNIQYQLAVRDEERSYKQQQDKLNRDYQKQLVDYKNQIDRANADKDYERSKALKLLVAEIEQQHKKEILELNNKNEQEILKLKNQYQQSEKAGSRANMQYQHDLYNSVPLAFNDGTGIRMSKNDYEGLLRFFDDKDNINTFLRDNPQLVKDYLTAVGGASMETNANNITVENPSTRQETSFLGFNMPYSGLYNDSTAHSTISATNQATNKEQTAKQTRDSVDTINAHDATNPSIVLDADTIADTEESILRGETGKYGIPLMKAGGSSFSAKPNNNTTRKEESAPKAKENKKKEGKESKYSKEDLDFMSQFE